MIGKFELTFDTTLPEDESRMKEVCAVLAGFQVVAQETSPVKPEPIVVPDAVVERMVEKVKEVTQPEEKVEEAPNSNPGKSTKPGKSTNAKSASTRTPSQVAQNSKVQEEQAEEPAAEEPEVQEEQAEEPEVQEEQAEEPVATAAVEPMGYEEAKRIIAPLYSNNDLRPKIQQLIQAHGGKEEIDGVVKTKLSAIGERGDDYRPLVTEVLAKYGK